MDTVAVSTGRSKWNSRRRYFTEDSEDLRLFSLYPRQNFKDNGAIMQTGSLCQRSWGDHHGWVGDKTWEVIQDEVQGGRSPCKLCNTMASRFLKDHPAFSVENRPEEKGFSSSSGGSWCTPGLTRVADTGSERGGSSDVDGFWESAKKIPDGLDKGNERGRIWEQHWCLFWSKWKDSMNLSWHGKGENLEKYSSLGSSKMSKKNLRDNV